MEEKEIEALASYFNVPAHEVSAFAEAVKQARIQGIREGFAKGREQYEPTQDDDGAWVAEWIYGDVNSYLKSKGLIEKAREGGK